MSVEKTADRIAALAAQLEDEDGTTRKRARQGLVEEGRAAVPAVVQALRRGSRQARWEAARVLEAIADPAAADALVRALEDDEFDVRWAAADALVALGRHGVIPALRTLMHRSDSEWVREVVEHVLHEQVDSEYGRVLEPVLESLKNLGAEQTSPVAAHKALLELEEMYGR